LRDVQEVEGVLQAWKIPKGEQVSLGLQNKHLVTSPLKRIEYRPNKKAGRDGGPPHKTKKKGLGPKSQRQQKVNEHAT
jgi:hypothetical protein